MFQSVLICVHLWLVSVISVLSVGFFSLDIVLYFLSSLMEMSSNFDLDFGRFNLKLSERTHIMGVLNVTPDSFSDGGLYIDKNEAVDRALTMVEEGVDIIDVGGESTRPGAKPVPLNEELKRVIPVIDAIAPEIKVPVSIDTYKSEVAEEAISAGASMVNEISGLRFDEKMGKVLSNADIPVVIMHIKGTPRDMQVNPQYTDLIGEIKEYLDRQTEFAQKNGIDKTIIDPGIGFGKKHEDNLVILKRLDEFKSIRRPILVGPSRKSFIGYVLDLPVEERLEGTLAACAVAILNGANILRVHDVRETVRVTRLVDAVRNAE